MIVALVIGTIELAQVLIAMLELHGRVGDAVAGARFRRARVRDRRPVRRRVGSVGGDVEARRHRDATAPVPRRTRICTSTSDGVTHAHRHFH